MHHHPVVHYHAVVEHAPVVTHETVVLNEVVRSTPVDTATIVVELPKDAKVFINGVETKASGTTRHFVSRGLEGDSTYEYAVRIVTADSESPREQTKTVRLARGQRETVKFDAAEATAVKKAEPKADSVAAAIGG